MRYGWSALIFAIAFMLQTGICGNFPIFGVSANLLLCCSVIITFAYPDDTSGIVLGGVFALLYDLVFSQFVGITAVPVVIVALCCIIAREYFLNNESTLSAAIISLISIVIYYNLYWVTVRLAGYGTAYVVMLQKLPVYVVMNWIIMMVIYAFMIRRVVKHKSDRYTRWADL